MAKPDPIGDLFSNPTPQAPAPVVASATTPKATGGGWSGVLLAVVLFCGLWYASSSGMLDRFKGDREQGDKQEQKQEQAAGVKPGVLYMVHDIKSAPADRVLLVQEVKAMRAAVQGVEYRQMDDSDDDTPQTQGVIKFAESKGIKPPFVAFKPAGKEISSVIAWPKDKAELMKVFK